MNLYICVLTAFCPSFPHLETLKKILENSTLSRYVKKKKKKKKKSRPTDPIFKFWSGEGNITIFFFWPNGAFQKNGVLEQNTLNRLVGGFWKKKKKNIYNFSLKPSRPPIYV